MVTQKNRKGQSNQYIYMVKNYCFGIFLGATVCYVYSILSLIMVETQLPFGS